MPPTRLPSDLVRDSKIETEVLGTETKHVFFAPGKSAKERQVRKEEIWVREECLGQGAFGIVHRERCHEGERKDKVRAVKEIKKRVAAGEELDYTRELEAIVKFSNPRYSHCFVSSDGWYETEASVFISMEYLELRDLQRYLTEPLHESDAREITAQVLEGLQIMHENDFVHRDLKPGNIMVVAKRPWFVKIADFGISKRRLDDVTSLRTLQRGTFGFAAPEIFGLGPGADAGSYTTAVDMWSLGAVVHKILTGCPPFQGLAEVFKYINGTTEFPHAGLKQRGISEHGQDFISSLMAQDPKDRLTSAGAANHPWMTMHLDTPETDISTIKSTSEARFNQITITTASGCWTPDRTVSELPVLTQTAAAPLSNYRPPAIDDCPTEPDVDPLNCLPKDSAVLLEVAGVSPEDDLPSLVDVIQLSPESGNPGAPAIDTPADMTPRTPTAPSTAKPGHLTVGRDTASTSKTPFIEAGSFHKLSAIPPQYLRVAMAYNGLPSRYPRVVSAYNALLAAIDECEDPDACDPLQQTLGLHLFLRGYPDSESTEPSDDGSSVESRVVGPPQSLREIPDACIMCGEDLYTALLPCNHRMCYSCLERRFKSFMEHDPERIPMPPSCHCGRVIPLHPDDLVDDGIRKIWNRVREEAFGRPQVKSANTVQIRPATRARFRFPPKSKEQLEHLGREDGNQLPYPIPPRSRLYGEAELHNDYREPTYRGLSQENDPYPRTMHLEHPQPRRTRRPVGSNGDGPAPRRHISYRPDSRPIRRSYVEKPYQPLTVGALELHELMNPVSNWDEHSGPGATYAG